jgi:hypothetical protein
MNKLFLVASLFVTVASQAELKDQRFHTVGDWMDTYNKAALRINAASAAESETKITVTYCDLKVYLEQNKRCLAWAQDTYEYNVSLDAFYIGDKAAHSENYLSGQIIANSLKADDSDLVLRRTFDPFGFQAETSVLSGHQAVYARP